MSGRRRSGNNYTWFSFEQVQCPTIPVGYVHSTSVCICLQGAKKVVLGDNTYVYDKDHFLLSSVDLPIVANIEEASQDVPYYGLVYHIDHHELTRMLVESEQAIAVTQKTDIGMAVSRSELPLLKSFLRLVELLDEPESIPVLSPMIQRELLFRLLQSSQGARLRQIGISGSNHQQVAKAVTWLKNNYAKPMRIEDVANYAGMSVSALHHHFKNITSTSPLQYQKWLRLHEARRLMIAERMDAANAAFEVGYESPSQFSREYKRLFGAPPLRDIKMFAAVAN